MHHLKGQTSTIPGPLISRDPNAYAILVTRVVARRGKYRSKSTSGATDVIAYIFQNKQKPIINQQLCWQSGLMRMTRNHILSRAQVRILHTASACVTFSNDSYIFAK